MKFNVKAMQQFHYLRVFFFSVFSLGGAVRAIIGLLHADMHQRGTVGSVCHLATSVITVAPGMKGDEAVAKLTKRSKSGKVMQDVSSVSFGMTVLFLHCYILLTFFFFLVLRRRFSVSKRILQSWCRAGPVMLEADRMTQRNKRCNTTKTSYIHAIKRYSRAESVIFVFL